MAKAGVSGPSLGAHLDLSKQRVGQLADEGVFQRRQDGSFGLDDCRVAYIRWLRSDDRRGVKSANADRMRAVRIEEIEQRMAERDRQMVADAQAETLKIVDEFGGPLKSDLMALPARVTADLALRRKIESAIDEAFNAAAGRAADAADRVPADGAALALAAAPKPRGVGSRKSGVSGKRRRAGPA